MQEVATTSNRLANANQLLSTHNANMKPGRTPPVLKAGRVRPLASTHSALCSGHNNTLGNNRELSRSSSIRRSLASSCGGCRELAAVRIMTRRGRTERTAASTNETRGSTTFVVHIVLVIIPYLLRWAPRNLPSWLNGPLTKRVCVLPGTQQEVLPSQTPSPTKETVLFERRRPLIRTSW